MVKRIPPIHYKNLWKTRKRSRGFYFKWYYNYSMSNNIKHRVWSVLISDGDIEKEFGSDEVEVQKQAVKHALDLWMEFNDLQLHLYHTYNTIKTSLEAAEDFDAEFTDLAQHNPDKDALLAINLGLEIDDIIWTNIEPESKDID